MKRAKLLLEGIQPKIVEFHHFLGRESYTEHYNCFCAAIEFKNLEIRVI